METKRSKDRINIAAGSCSKQLRSQKYWKQVGKENSTAFLWLGDSVYAPKRTVDSLATSFDILFRNKDYIAFRQGRLIDGVWDDHDLGSNDGGKHTRDIEKRAHFFRSFINASNSNQTISWPDEKECVYHSSRIWSPKHTHSILVVFLDTRCGRDYHFIPSLAETGLRGSALAAAGLRTLYSSMGLGRKYEGRMMSEKQWSWLNHTLSTSDADFHIIVSSVQVLTSCPVIESWGHFPNEKQRLLNLLSVHNPRGLILMSGDIHQAELSVAAVHVHDHGDGSDASNANNRPVTTSRKLWEVTTSGLTHANRDDFILRKLSDYMTVLFQAHRPQAEQNLDDDDDSNKIRMRSNNGSSSSVFSGRNFATIRTRPAHDAQQQIYVMDIVVRDLSDGTPVLQRSIVSEPLAGTSTGARVVFIESAEFPVLSSSTIVSLLLAVIMMVLVVVGISVKVMRRKSIMSRDKEHSS